MRRPDETLLTSASPRRDLETRLADHEAAISEMLRPYEPLTAYAAIMDLVRTAEEVINLHFADWKDEATRQIVLLRPLRTYQDYPDKLATLHRNLTRQFSEKFANRFRNLILQANAMAMTMDTFGFSEAAAGLSSLASMMGYCQSRRRHFVGLMNLVPTACRGTERLTLLDALPVFLPIVELQGIQMMGAQYALIEKVCCERLDIPQVRPGELQMLDNYFLEPERARVTDMPWTEAARQIMATSETVPSDRLFSAAELRNDIKMVRAAYAEFDLSTTDFEPASRFVEHVSQSFVERDFWVRISPESLKQVFRNLDTPPILQAALINSGKTYSECLSTYAPFVFINGEYRSTVTLLSRFIYYWRGRVLDRRKRYQIRAGFIFEKAVSEILESQGFSIQNITRVKRAEFDVVSVRNGIIWNIQCKNNWVDLERVDTNADRFAHYNRKYVRSYEGALAKERGREALLKQRLGLNTIEHIVVSKFPVITDNPRILPLNSLRHFTTHADYLETLERQ